MSTITIEQITQQDELYPQVWQLREEVLRNPLGLSLRDEDLSGEQVETTLAAVQDGVVKGCVMLRPAGNGELKLRQMAVAPQVQGGGLGRMLVMAAAGWAKQNGFTRISMHARISAAGFYEKLGYSRQGDVFTEVTIPHVRMTKEL